jgi:hypothetical protein
LSWRSEGAAGNGGPFFIVSPDLLELREGFDQLQRNALKAAGQESDACRDPKDPDSFLDPSELQAQMARRMHEGTDRGGGEDERETQSEAVDGQQSRAAGDSVPAAGDGKNAGQDWTDAGSPAEGEGETHRIGAPQACGFLKLNSLLA